MKQINNIKTLKAWLLAGLLALQFFAFGITNIASAAASDCIFTIDSFTVNKTSALPNDTLNFSSKVSTKTTKLNSCTGQTVQIWLNFKNYYSFKNTQIGSKTFKLTTDVNQLSADFSVNLSNYNLNGLSPTNQLKFELYVNADNTNGTPALNRAISPATTVYLTASSGSSGSVKPTISFKPQKDIYSIGENLQIMVTAPANQVNNLNSGITDIFIQPTVNGKNLPGFTVKRAAMAVATQWKDTEVTSANGFIAGQQNNITVSLWQAGESIKLGEGTATMQVASQTGGNENPEVIASTYNTVMGAKVSLALKNFPEGWSGSYKINDQPAIEFKNNNLELTLVSEIGFKDKQQNVIQFAGLTKTGVPLSIKDEGIVRINVDPKNSTASNASSTPGQNNGNANTTLINPLPTGDLLSTFLSIAKGFLTGIAIWAVIFIIVGGFRLVVASGNEEAIAQGKKTITWAVLGLVVALLSFSIVAIVQNLLGVDVEKLDPGTTPKPSSYNITIQKYKV